MKDIEFSMLAICTNLQHLQREKILVENSRRQLPNSLSHE